MELIEGLTNLAILAELAFAVWLLWRNRSEIRYLERDLKSRLPQDENLPLLSVLISRAKGVSRIGVYLLVITVVGGVLTLANTSLAAIFPPIRAINGLLFIYLIAGPLHVGRALRRDRSLFAMLRGAEREPRADA